MLKNIKIFFISITFLFINGCEQKVETKIDETLIETGKVIDGAFLYRKELKQHCKISGYALAMKNSKKEWKTLAQNGKLAKEIKKICPTIKYNHNWTPDLYEFLHQNAISNTTSSPTEYQASYQQQ